MKPSQKNKTIKTTQKNKTHKNNEKSTKSIRKNIITWKPITKLKKQNKAITKLYKQVEIEVKQQMTAENIKNTIN